MGPQLLRFANFFRFIHLCLTRGVRVVPVCCTDHDPQLVLMSIIRLTVYVLLWSIICSVSFLYMRG